MVEFIKSIRGMPDILPDETLKWQYLENCISKIMKSYGYNEIRFPILEKTELFKRSIGEVTDIVSKEMFTFLDQNQSSITLRPEGTASCVRACIEHSLLRNGQQQHLWYLGPMFRYERPQQGRYRQFSQLGVESFGLDGWQIEVEHILMISRLWKQLGIEKQVCLELNSLGTTESRTEYRKNLIEYFQDNYSLLDEDSKSRLLKNPLRILDSKNISLQEIIKKAPKLIDFLDNYSQECFLELQQQLKKLKINFKINHKLVRGLDYYNSTVYEWVTDELGSQSALGGGGRYDSLVRLLGGPSVPAVGFSMGLERIMLLLAKYNQVDNRIENKLDAYFICTDSKVQDKIINIAENIRDKLPDLKLAVNHSGGNLKKQFKKADKSGAKVALIIGDTELAQGKISIKFLRKDCPQQIIAVDNISEFLGGYCEY